MLWPYITLAISRDLRVEVKLTWSFRNLVVLLMNVHISRVLHEASHCVDGVHFGTHILSTLKKDVAPGKISEGLSEPTAEGLSVSGLGIGIGLPSAHRARGVYSVII